MRATWAGARSGRSAIWTVPLVVSRMSLSPSAFSVMGCPCLLELAVVDEPDGERAPGKRAAERIGERQRRAATQRPRHRDPIGQPLIVRRTRAFIGDRKS